MIVSSAELITLSFEAIVQGDSGAAQAYAGQWLKLGLPALELVTDALTPGIKHVGELWEQGDFFLPELVAGAEAMKAAMGILAMELARDSRGQAGGEPVVIGTVHGDIHDIGKSLVAAMLRAHGFAVDDLGADVPHDRFIAAQQSSGARLICLSALLTTTMVGIKEAIAQFIAAGIRRQVKILVGGAPVTKNWALANGADAYAANAVEAVTVAKSLLS